MSRKTRRDEREEDYMTLTEWSEREREKRKDQKIKEDRKSKADRKASAFLDVYF